LQRFPRKKTAPEHEKWSLDRVGSGDMIQPQREKKRDANPMYSFILCIILLVVGYAICGKHMERVFGPDHRETPRPSAWRTAGNIV